MTTHEVKMALDALARVHGVVTPEHVVDAARDPESPLHGYFEWDDVEAAEAHRRDQARALLRSWRIRVVTNNVTVDVPAFVRAIEHRAGYVKIDEMMLSSAERRRSLLIEEFQRAASALRRARDLASVLGVERDGEFDGLLGEVERMSEVVVSTARQ